MPRVSFEVDRFAPEIWNLGSENLFEWPQQSTQNLGQHSAYLPKFEKEIPSADHPSSSYSIQHSPAPLLFDYTMATGTSHHVSRATELESEMTNNIAPRIYPHPGLTFQNGENDSMLNFHMHCNGKLNGHTTQKPISEVRHASKIIKPRCGWPGCKYTGKFTSKASLNRHIGTQHIAPGAYRCPVVNCHKDFNRKDNQIEHVRRKHRISF